MVGAEERVWSSRAAAALGLPSVTIERLGAGDLADSTVKLRVRGPSGAPAGMLLCSSPGGPGLVARGVARAREIRAAVSPAVGDAILLPIGEGLEGELSWAIYPWREPLIDDRSRLGRLFGSLRLTDPLLGWLRDLVRETRHAPDDAELAAELELPLAALAGDRRLPSPVAVLAAREALAALERGWWRPMRTAMHGDLWAGNLLHDPTRPRGTPLRERLAVIDWPGARLRGWAIFDLLKLAASMRLSRAVLAREAAAQCELLGDPPHAARWHLTAALAAVHATLEHFAPDRFARLCDRSLLALDRALAG